MISDNFAQIRSIATHQDLLSFNIKCIKLIVWANKTTAFHHKKHAIKSTLKRPGLGIFENGISNEMES